MRNTWSEPDTVPIVTWILLGVAALVLAAAGAIAVKGPSKAARDVQPREAEADSRHASAEKSAELDPHSIQSPLSITAELLDAESRSHLWNSEAVLTSIQTLIGPGGTKTPIEIEFGIPKANKVAVAGAPLGTERLAVLYSSGRAVQTPRTGKANALGVAPPNCPLEVASLKTPLGRPTDKSVAVLYSYSKKHGRPIWHFTDSSGSVHRVDGHSCAILLH